jgi:hypothetical protein
MQLGSIQGLTRTHGIVGPWPCEKCGKLSQYADLTSKINRIFCKNENCRYMRVVDKWNKYIVEDDGTHWKFSDDGTKVRVR